MNSKNITGGKRGFIAAIDAAFRSNAINPTIRYSHARGFFVESGLHRAEEDVLWQCAANYLAPCGRRSMRPCDYTDVRIVILNPID